MPVLQNAVITYWSKSQNKYVYAIGKVGDQVKLLLDPDRLLNDEEITEPFPYIFNRLNLVIHIHLFT